MCIRDSFKCFQGIVTFRYSNFLPHASIAYLIAAMISSGSNCRKFRRANPGRDSNIRRRSGFSSTHDLSPSGVHRRAEFTWSGSSISVTVRAPIAAARCALSLIHI